ncbi:MAG: hypothetical protein P4M08_06580 [Oligoflexia bacterium]|nr:hypothetical protein [Oligoflexia bacterium]
MKRSPTKRNVERRKKPRSARATQDSAKKSASPDACYHCGKKLSGKEERALFVEEEIGRIFCGEACIAAYFAPEIERLEKEYFRRLAPNDLSAEERESLAHLRWITLQEPDEIWREKTLSGDYRYTLISEFKPGTKKIWSICICLFLRGEPSFLYLALTTKNSAMANTYRRGERMEWAQGRSPKASQDVAGAQPRAQSGEWDQADSVEKDSMGAQIDGNGEAGLGASEPTDRLADPWTADETLMAKMNQERRGDDIQPDDFARYQTHIESTLETPDEVWSIQARGPEGPKLYHFIRHISDAEESRGVWYVVVARELDEQTVDEQDQIEILDAFPTRDPFLVESYRQGVQEVGREGSETTPAKATARVVH